MKFRFPPVFIFLALALISAFPALAKDEWIRVRSRNFHLIGNASEKDIRLVATKLEQFRETFRLLFPSMKISTPVETAVIVFRSANAFRPYKPKRPDGTPDDGVAGYFQASDAVNYITLSTERQNEDPYSTIFHEYVHFMVDASIGKSRVPPWFNEGLAEYYQTFAIANDRRVMLGYVQNAHLVLLRRSKLIPLKQFFEVDNYSLQASGGHSRSIFYAQAWALMHYLLRGDNGAHATGLERFLALVLRDVDPDQAFRQAFNTDHETMEKALRKYVLDGKYTATQFDLKERLVIDTDMTVSALSEAETFAYLGDLLLNTREYEAAEAHLKKTLALMPKHERALTSLGLVKMRQRRFDESKNLLEQALSDGHRSFYALYSYAYVLSREAVDEFGYVARFPDSTARRIRDVLSQALEINPQFAESYKLLAYVSLVNGDDLDGAVKTLEKGLAIKPGDPDLLLLYAKILLRQEKLDAARSLADRVARSTDKQDVRSEAEDLISSIQQITETKAALERQIAEANAQMREAGAISSGRPILLKRSQLTDEQVRQIDADRINLNTNRLLKPLAADERRLVGRIEKVSCQKGKVSFQVRAESGTFNLSARDFLGLELAILREGTENIEVGCGAALDHNVVVITYKPSETERGSTGVINAIAFVPSDFRLLSTREIAESRQVIIEGGPPSDLRKNAEIIAEQDADLERKRRAAMLRQLELMLRKPAPGEVRLVGSVERIECRGQEVFFVIAANSGTLRLKAPPSAALVLTVFDPSLGAVQLGCGDSIRGAKAVITYLPLEKKDSAGDLRAVEFVPAGFDLP